MLRVTDFSSRLMVIAASVATGLEKIAALEIKERLGGTEWDGEVSIFQGRVCVVTRREAIPILHKLKSVDRLFLIVKTFEDYEYEDRKDAIHDDLKQMAMTLPWAEVVKVWEYNLQFCKPKSRQKNLRKGDWRKDRPDKLPPANGDSTDNIRITPVESENHESIDNDDKGNVLNIPKFTCGGELIRFRVSSNRVGKKQPITSPEASYSFGGQIQDFTQWKVDLSNFNFEVLLSLGVNSLQVAVALTNQSLHRRNITHFGITTLRPTTAYCMLKMCEIEPGDIVFDPMCGSGAIPVEGALEWPDCFHIGGDIVNGAVSRSLGNVRFINDNPHFASHKSHAESNMEMRGNYHLPVDIIRWDVTNLPVKSESVDVVVSDLPFGKRIGSKVDNRKLYPETLRELARIAKRKTGRACLLTQDKRTMKKVLESMSSLWKVTKNLYINIGGLTAGVYLLKRTENFFDDCKEPL